MPDFEPFPKIPRLNRDVIVTEKIDGTNAAIHVTEDGDLFVQSRKRFITPESDNFGFAQWVDDHATALCNALGTGVHFGEWWGSGIQRGYGLGATGTRDRRFSLFNSHRWEPALEGGAFDDIPGLGVVPTLAAGPLDPAVNAALFALARAGSFAQPGYMKPEGIVIYHTAARSYFKVTLEDDGVPKALAA